MLLLPVGFFCEAAAVKHTLKQQLYVFDIYRAAPAENLYFADLNQLILPFCSDVL